MRSSNRLIISILVLTGAAIGFWVLLLGPKREEADRLSSEAGQLQVAVSEAQSQAIAAEEARREFPTDYRKVVVLGQAVPAGDETSSLLIELNTIARRAKVRFDRIQLESGGGAPGAAAPAAAPAPEATPAAPSSGAVPASSTIPPTEAAASLLPLGAAVGSAGLAAMPYALTFSGNFFQIANFIDGVDSLVHTGANSKIAVDGRLVTVDGFAITTEPESTILKATFSVTTYVTPPSQGLTAGATAAAPAPVTTPGGAEEAATESVATTTSSETN